MRSLLIAIWLVAALPSTARAENADPTACAKGAAMMHRVNQQMLEAILRIESRLNPRTMSPNSNGTWDLGIAGINTIHLPELAKFGIAPSHLLNACVGIYVAAWMVSKNLHKYGNSWFAYAAYHSRTPYYNHRYQIMLANELVRAGVVAGTVHPVPPLKQQEMR
jgi:soluble lytic murein transglycosylase-like protein